MYSLPLQAFGGPKAIIAILEMVNLFSPFNTVFILGKLCVIFTVSENYIYNL